MLQRLMESFCNVDKDDKICTARMQKSYEANDASIKLLEIAAVTNM